jgi:N-methylhydantoinase B
LWQPMPSSLPFTNHSPVGSDVDPFTVELILNALSAAAHEMFVTLQRTAKSPIIYEVLDFACGIYSAEGKLIAQDNGVMGFLGTLYFAVREVREKFDGQMQPGDIFITNDPWTSNGSHLSDVNLVLPIFMGDRLMGLAVNKAHWTEVGGKYPGSWSASTIDVFQEGLLFPCVRLFRSGEIDQALVDIIEANVRVPDDTLGDMHAQAAAVKIGAERVEGILDKYGPDAFERSITIHLERGSRRAREAMLRLPRGTFQMEDLLENNGVDGEPIPVRAKLTISDDTFTVDVSGNLPPVPTSVNGTAVGVRAQCRTIFKVVGSPHSAPNEGEFEPVVCIAPEGTVFTAPKPAAVSIHWEYKSILSDMIFRALAPHIPDRLPAGHQLSTCASIVSGKDAEGEYWLLVEPSLGGWGAAIDADGQQGQHPMGNGETYNTPVEVIENRYPIRVERYGFDTDTPAGAGRFRGGLGVIKDYRILDEAGATVTATFGRHHRPPWGVDSGQNGSPNRVEFFRQGAESPCLTTGTVAGFEMNPGDRVRFITATGGGWGDAFHRDPELVARDVRNEFVSVETARTNYGVILDVVGLTVDNGATAQERAKGSRRPRQASPSPCQ